MSGSCLYCQSPTENKSGACLDCRALRWHERTPTDWPTYLRCDECGAEPGHCCRDDDDQPMLRPCNVLIVAAMRHRVRLPRLVHGVGQKPWDRAWRCAMEMLRMAWNDNVSLEQACIGFGLPMSFGEAGDIKGSEVGAAIARGEIARVAHHCSTDVRRLREVWRFIRSVDELEQPVDEGAVRRIMAQMGAPKGES